MSAWVIVPPKGSDGALSPDIPHRHRQVLVFQGFHIEADRRDRVHDLADFQLVQDRRLPCNNDRSTRES